MSNQIPARQLWFDAPQRVSVREVFLPPPAPGEVLVRTTFSAVSAGTEMLAYRGQFPRGMRVDASLASLQGDFVYPLRYGYACVGVVEALGEGVPPEWNGRNVFAFQPHASAFVSSVHDLIPIPDGISHQMAAFYANMETAVTLALDGAPLLGERVLVMGLGVVGLLTATVLRSFPLAQLLCVEKDAGRAAIARTLGLETIAPDDLQPGMDFDLAFELSGNPAALNAALAAVGYAGRVVIGSWYGDKPVMLALGGEFHRSRIQLVSSQVSSLAPSLRGRWERQRRTATAWALLAKLAQWRDPQGRDFCEIATRRFPLSAAPEVYSDLNRALQTLLQALFDYSL